jgi:iron complex outermembrane receptor protein
MWPLVALPAAAQNPERQPPTPAASARQTASLFDLSLEDLMQVKVSRVEGASKREQGLADAPSSVTIITSQDIKQYGYRTLADVLNSVRGVYATNNRSYSFLGVRGFNRPGDYGGRNLLLVDGHRLNEPMFDTSPFGYELGVDLDLVDRVEIVRGPGSTLYGNNAFFSVVNVITKRGRDYRRGEVSVHGGSFESRQARASMGREFANGVEFLVSGTTFDSAGQQRIAFQAADADEVLPNGGVAEGLDYERVRSFFTKWRYRRVTVTSLASTRVKGVPHASFGTVFNDPTYHTDDEQAFVDVKFDRPATRGWSVLARANYNQYRYDSDSVYDYGGTGIPSDYTVNADWARARWLGAEAQVGRAVKRSYVTLGAEFRDYSRERYQNEDREPHAVYSNVDTSDTTWGGFANLSAPLPGTFLTLDTGVRYDGFTSFGAAVNPRAALIARPFAGTAIKALYAHAYRAPNVYEANFSGPGSISNSELRPETIRSREVVWEQQYGRHLRTSVNWYSNRIGGLIAREAVPDTDLIHVVNRGAVDAEGTEFEIEARHATTGFRGRASYARQHTLDHAADGPLSNSPAHLTKFNVVLPLRRGRVFVSPEARHQSDVRTVYGTQGGSFWVVNATLVGQEIRKGLDLSVSTRNMLNSRYAFPGGPEHAMAWIPQPGRTVQATLVFRN